MSSPASLKPMRNDILVVDDEAAIRELLVEGLEAFGFNAREVPNVEEALRALAGGGIGLVLSDIDMPGESGLDLLQRVKARDPDIDVVMVTGVIDVDVAVRALRDGASDYVTKPFNLEEVRIVVESTFEKRRLILENRSYQQHLEEKVEERTAALLHKTREVEGLYRDLEASYENTLRSLITALDFRDNETQGHSSRVVEYAVIVARTLGVDGPELAWIRRGAILHDVGKIGVPDSILHKPGKLEPEEYEQMKKHPEMGYRMLRHIPFLTPALDIVLSHQERWDGSGYPRGLKGEEIPLGARIFAVVDTFDAMTSDRPYRAALTVDQACEEIRRFAGIQFDPAIAEVFLRIPKETWIGIRQRVHGESLDLDDQLRRLR